MTSLFEVYEPHTQYLRAVTLTEDNFDALADELSKHGYTVSKTISWGKPVSLSVSTEHMTQPLTCNLYQCLVHDPSKPLTVMERHELRAAWRKTAADPYR